MSTNDHPTDPDAATKAKHSPRCVEMGWWLLHELDDGASCDTADDVATPPAPAKSAPYTPPATHHPRRCYCGQFGPGHAPGLISRGGLAGSCNGDTAQPHDPETCPACLAGATDYRPAIEAGQTWISNRHGTDHQVAGPGDEAGTWAMWGPVGNLYVTTAERIYTAYTLDLDR